jgi:Acetyltransferase (GNAT) family
VERDIVGNNPSPGHGAIRLGATDYQNTIPLHGSRSVVQGRQCPEETMNFRFARESDLPTLMALVNEAFHVERFFLIGNRLDLESTLQHFEKGRFLLAEEGSVLVGCVYVELQGDRGYLGLVSVDPARQKSDIGRELVS